jgi:hypothetical protein
VAVAGGVGADDGQVDHRAAVHLGALYDVADRRDARVAEAVGDRVARRGLEHLDPLRARGQRPAERLGLAAADLEAVARLGDLFLIHRQRAGGARGHECDRGCGGADAGPDHRRTRSVCRSIVPSLQKKPSSRRLSRWTITFVRP